MGKAKIIPERNTILLPYQSRWVMDRSRIKGAEKSRQIGWTWATAYDQVRLKAQQDALLDSWITSRDQLQAQLFIKDLKSWAGVLQIGAEDLGEKVIEEGKGSAHTLQFANGVMAYSLSSNADAQAGKRGDRVLDEFALNPNPRHLYGIAYPGITWGGQLSFFSTHRGTGNYFNELINEVRHKGNPKNISLHRVTLRDALDQGFLYKLQSKLPADDDRQEMDEADYFNDVRAKCPDEETFLQEYMCVPGDDESAFLSYDLIAGCEYQPTESWELTVQELAACGDPLYLGGDIGRRKDLTVFWVLQKAASQRITRKLITLEKETFAAQEAILYELLRLPNLRRACIDDTGIGMQFVERAQQKFGKYKVEGVTFTNAVKEGLAYPVRAAFEDKSVRIPNDPKVRSDLRAIRKETTASGNIRFTADASPNGHADRFWALALALHAGKTKGGYFASVI